MPTPLPAPIDITAVVFRNLHLVQRMLDKGTHFSEVQRMLDKLFDSSYGCSIDLETGIVEECNININLDKNTDYDVVWTRFSPDVRITFVDWEGA